MTATICRTCGADIKRWLGDEFGDWYHVESGQMACPGGPDAVPYYGRMCCEYHTQTCEHGDYCCPECVEAGAVV